MGSVFDIVFAALTFATTLFSLPMIADRDFDIVTAVVSSVNAVFRKKRIAVFSASLIALITLLGFATAFVGLGLLMPWLAYSAWHSYRETLDCSLWPRLHAIHDDAPLRERE